MTDYHEPDDTSEADALLLEQLGAALGTMPPDDGLIARCEGLLTWLDVDAELAELLDQAPAELAGTRGGAGDATGMEFSIADGSCIVEIRLERGTLHGQVVGPTPAAVAVRVVSGVVEPAPLDAHGMFTIDHPPSGSARVEIQMNDGRRIHTDWFVI